MLKQGEMATISNNRLRYAMERHCKWLQQQKVSTLWGSHLCKAIAWLIFCNNSAKLLLIEGNLENVPDSRSAIFKDRKLFFTEKNQLMRFFKLIQGHLEAVASADGGDSNESKSILEQDLASLFVEFLSKIRLSPKLKSYRSNSKLLKFTKTVKKIDHWRIKRIHGDMLLQKFLSMRSMIPKWMFLICFDIAGGWYVCIQDLISWRKKEIQWDPPYLAVYMIKGCPPFPTKQEIEVAKAYVANELARFKASQKLYAHGLRG